MKGTSGWNHLANAFIVVGAFAMLVNAGIPMPRYEALMRQQSSDLGLYNASDKVIILTDVNFNGSVIQQNHSSLVEFYNSYCGHCKRFAPLYKQLADNLSAWRDILEISAIDCAAEENNDICREYEIMAYPTLRYMGPNFVPQAGNYGTPIETQKLNEIRNLLARFLAAENRTMVSNKWPKFESLRAEETPSLFEGLDSLAEYVALVYDPENSTIGIETILHFLRWPNIKIRRVSDPSVATKFEMDESSPRIAIIDRQNKIETYATKNATLDEYVEVISGFLKKYHLTERPILNPRDDSSNTQSNVSLDAELKGNLEIIEEVKRNKHLVYLADLEMAVHGMLFNEIPKHAHISGERLLALQRFMAALNRYNPLESNGRNLVSKLYDFVVDYNQELSGREFEQKLKAINQKLVAFSSESSNNYVGCLASRPGLRGFTCSVWQLFHYMTVRAAQSEDSQDPIEVLQAMHGYVKYFFGCTECAEHFQSMAARRKIWSTPNKEEAVLWLWAAHNEVNQRLAGDTTEDPQFPKIQFPAPSSCAKCYRQPVMSPANIDINWNKNEVLSFLKNIYNPEYISHYGWSGSSADKQRRKRMTSASVFSNIDISMGMAFYGFCFLMIGIVGKLLCFKGYRRKPYSHDLLGKV